MKKILSFILLSVYTIGGSGVTAASKSSYVGSKSVSLKSDELEIQGFTRENTVSPAVSLTAFPPLRFCGACDVGVLSFSAAAFFRFF